MYKFWAQLEYSSLFDPQMYFNSHLILYRMCWVDNLIDSYMNLLVNLMDNFMSLLVICYRHLFDCGEHLVGRRPKKVESVMTIVLRLLTNENTSLEVGDTFKYSILEADSIFDCWKSSVLGVCEVIYLMQIWTELVCFETRKAGQGRDDN